MNTGETWRKTKRRRREGRKEKKESGEGGERERGKEKRDEDCVREEEKKGLGEGNKVQGIETE